MTLEILTYLRLQDPGDVLGRKQTSFGEQILLCFLGSICVATPAALGGFCAGLLLWLPKNVENSVHGQTLLRGIGVSSKVGLITVCVLGLIVGLIVGVGFSAVLIRFSLQQLPPQIVTAGTRIFFAGNLTVQQTNSATA